MRKNDFLRKAHVLLKPRTYLEIGVANGKSLAQSRTRSIGVDPNFEINVEIQCNLRLVRATSDSFFARKDAMSFFRGQPADLAFIDGMHVFEFALRDFMNVEKHAAWSSVIVFDDMLPRNVNEAARDRHTGSWAGDVFKVMPVLQEYRPDLQLLPVHTQPTGVLVILGADPSNTVLHDNYDEIVRRYATPDPQDVPESVMERTFGYPPADVLDGKFWQALRGDRGKRRWRMRRVRRSVERSFHVKSNVTPALREMLR